MTFSIVARDPETGAFGVATATGGPVVGSLVPHARAGVGAIATQSNTNPHYGFDGLRLLEAPESAADEVLGRLLATDEGRDKRQCVVVDRRGRTAAWTGPECTPVAAALTRLDLAVAGNLLIGADVLDAMIAAFESESGRLEDRMLAALLAGNRRGGDRRGVRSAALKVYAAELYPAVDIRADWSATPIEDLSSILAAVRQPDYVDFLDTRPGR